MEQLDPVYTPHSKQREDHSYPTQQDTRRWLYVSESCSVVSDSLRPHGLCSPWNSLGQNIEVGSLSFLQWIIPTQESNWDILHCRQIRYQLHSIFCIRGHFWCLQGLNHSYIESTVIQSPGSRVRCGYSSPCSATSRLLRLFTWTSVIVTSANIDFLGITELKSTGMGEFNSDEKYQ